MGRTWDVVIVGGGIVGCVAAKYLAPDHDVLVLEKDQVAGGTTGKASGLISIAADYIAQPGAARYALERFEAYDGTGHFEYTRRPNVELVAQGDEAAAREKAATLAEHFDVEYLDSRDAVEDRYPGVFDLDPFTGAIDIQEGGWVDPYTLATTYRADAEADGASFETGVTVTSVLADDGTVTGVETADGAVTGIETTDGAVTGVQTTDGVIEADHVVVATGWRTRDLLAEYVELPVRPFRYQTVNLAVDRDLPEFFPIGWERLTRCYWRAEHNGDLHVGGGTYFVDDPGSSRSSITPAFRQLVAEMVPERFRDLGDVRIVSEDTCATGDAATPDAYPILAAVGPNGLVVATGMHGFGIMAAPVAGAAVRSFVADEPAPFSLEAFALDRFADRSTDFESTYIAE